MARIRLDLNQFKASGVYTVEFDASEQIVLNTQTTRLVVGFSRKGPFNAPVFLPDVKTAKRVFGDIDPFLERRGAFFHRSLFTCLQIGPVFGLNLLPLNNAPIDEGGDAVDYRSFSLDTAETNGVETSALFSSFYNKERFWAPDTTYFQATVDADLDNSGKLFNMVNLGQTPMSLIIKKSPKADVKTFDLTAREWYGATNVPAYMNEWDYVSDYFIDVYAIEGDWTDYATLAIDPFFSKYFDTTGLKKAKMNDFLNATEVKVIANFRGCIIPEFVDGNGINYSIDTIINQAIATTGLFVAVNREALEDFDPATAAHTIDLIGHNLADPASTITSVDFLSYKTAVNELLSYTEATSHTETTYTPDADQLDGDGFYATIDHAHEGGNSGYFGNVLVVPKPAATQETGFTPTTYAALKDGLVVGKSAILLNSAGRYGKVESVTEVTDTDMPGGKKLKVVISNPSKATEPTTTNVAITAITTTVGAMALTVTGDLSAALAIGDVFLIEHPTTGAYYYATVRDTVTFSTPSSTIPIEDLTGIASVTTSFKVRYGYTLAPDNNVSSDGSITVVYEPDMFTVDAAVTPDVFVGYEYSAAYVDYVANALTNGDRYYPSSTASAVQYVGVTKTTDADGLNIIKIKLYSDEELTTVINVISPGFNNYKKDADGALVVAGSGTLAIYSSAGNLADRMLLTSYNNSKTTFSIAEADKDGIEVGHFVVSETTDEDDNPVYRLTRVLSKKKIINVTDGVVTYQFTVNQPIRVIGTGSEEYVERFLPIEDFVTSYTLTHLGGFTLGSYHLPGDRTNKAAQLAKILGVLDEANSNLAAALSSNDIIQFRYIVDTFDGGLNANGYPKNYLTKLAKTRQKCLAIMNAPSIKEFTDSTDPRFTEAPDAAAGNPKPLLNTRYIADGGNLTLGPSFTFSLPDEENGAKFAGYFGPFLTIRENGKNHNIPPAAHVSNLFVQKFINGTPYGIVAGTRRGVISEPRLVGLEYDFTQTDREFLEPFGYNPIIKKRGVGIMVFGNQTAYQKSPSAFNNLHVRDLLITITETVEDILSRYTFESNTPQIRLEIKNIVSGYLTTVQSDGGVYNFQVVINDKNNTKDIIDQNIAIVDIGIEPVRGMQKLINRITVLSTDGISSGGFTVA